MNRRFGISMNGNLHGELKDPELSVEGDLARRLALLDGKVRYSLAIWGIPEGQAFDLLDLEAATRTFIQCAGSQSGFITEMGWSGDRAEPHLVRLRPLGSVVDELEHVAVQWGQHSTMASISEVLSYDATLQAFLLFMKGEGLQSKFASRTILP